MTKRIFSIYLATALLVLSVAATASAQFVSEWDYTYQAGFTAWTPVENDSPDDIMATDPTAINTNGGPVNGWHKLTWGTPVSPGGEQSFVEIDPVGPGTVLTNGPSADAATLRHGNNTIRTASTQLVTGEVQTSLTLSPAVPFVGPEDIFAVEFTFRFFETVNTEFDHDYFILTSGADDITGTFDVMGDTYFLDFTQSFQNLNEVAGEDTLQALLGPAYDPELTYIGWQTIEPGLTEIPTFFTITHVPEPSTFALLGLGILGFAIYARRRTVQD